jgi:diaminopimelate epimerase
VRISFTKMHGAGNDFVVIDARNLQLDLSPAQARHVADRQRGIGCDQILVLHASNEADFAYRIFNAQGGEVQQCGNGARALALLGYELLGAERSQPPEVLTMQSPAGLVRARVESSDQISVDMGAPRFAPSALPMDTPQQEDGYSVSLKGQTLEFGAVSMGNPHAVLTVPDVTTADVENIGQALQQHALFPESVNVGFMQILARDAIVLRVYERGVGETLACGTGACAAVAIGQARGALDARVGVTLPGGELMVNSVPPDQRLWLTGPAHVAFKGHIDL